MNDINLIGRLVRSPGVKDNADGDIGCVFLHWPLTAEIRTKAQTSSHAQRGQKTGEIINEYCVKGQLIGVTGRLQIRPFTDKEGNKRTAAEVIVSTFDFCERKTETASQAPTNDFYGDRGRWRLVAIFKVVR